MRNPAWLYKDHAADVYSQAGEDGVIEAALAQLPHIHCLVVEFGAHDGATNSNSRQLILDYDFDAVLIEADPARYAKLAETYAGTPGVKTINAMVGTDAETGLDRVLSRAGLIIHPDLVVIDIDGEDYQAWSAMQIVRPQLVMVEFNPTMACGMKWVQPPEDACPFRTGSSLDSLVALGREKGYELISVLPWNALFCRSELFPRFEIADNRSATLRTYRDMIGYRFYTYDGAELAAGARRNPWVQEP
jgi:hypothetical protein